MVTTQHEEADACIAVTDAGAHYLLYRALLKESIPVLRTPERYSLEERTMLVQRIRSALDEATESDSSIDNPEGLCP